MSRRPAPIVQVEGQLDLFAEDPEPAEQVPAQAAPGPTTVVDLHGHKDDPAYADVLYVGRPHYVGGWRLHGHALANPYKVKNGDQAEAVARYREWLMRRPGLVADLLELRGRRLGCWCPEGSPCHARVLAELADQVIDI